MCRSESERSEARHGSSHGGLKRRADYTFMPSTEEMVETSTMMQERFHLPRFAMAVDGMMVRFVEAPRGLPPGKHEQQFWCRCKIFKIV